MKKITAAILTLLLSTMLFTACSEDEKNLAEKASDKIDEITTETGHAMANKIKTPINKARMTQNLGDERLEEMDKAIEGQ